MSEGLMCLTCRRYIGESKWSCKCADPHYSLDGKTRLPPAQEPPAFLLEKKVMRREGECICSNPEAWGYTCPVHKAVCRAQVPNRRLENHDGGAVHGEIKICPMGRVQEKVRGYKHLYHICDDCVCQTRS